MRFVPLFAALPMLLLGACATSPAGSAPAPRAAAESPPAQAGRSPYGMFLAGEAALNAGRNSDAARFFDQARAEAREPMVAERAFMATLLSGDVTRAALMAPTGADTAESTKRLARLTAAVEALATGKNKEARTLLAGESIGFPHRPAAVLLQPWAAAGAGDVDGSLVRPVVRGDRLVEYFGQIGQGHLYERARRYDEAETDFKAAATSAPSEAAILAYGGFLERRGRRLDAISLYQTFLASHPGSESTRRARERAQAGKQVPPAPSLKEGAAQVLLAPAAGMVANREATIALAYLRLVLRLDPQSDEAWVLVGDLMQAQGDYEAARAAYAHVRPSSSEFVSTQSKTAWTYQAAGDKAAAIRLARTAAAGGDVDARVNLADLLRNDDQCGEAIQVLTSVIDATASPDWRLLYARGGCYQTVGRRADAEADLQRALKDHPDEPELLNFLGFSWIDRGEHLDEALAMVKKASAADPRSGAITDSLGWAYFRLGDYAQAVGKLEQAVELEAGDPEINDHLGDAYWKAGRQDEARFQWRRVLTLNPDDKIRARATAKLASGLGPDGPAPKVAGN